jgi:hypothetical protein
MPQQYHRIAGYDIARALAIMSMVFVNYPYCTLYRGHIQDCMYTMADNAHQLGRSISDRICRTRMDRSWSSHSIPFGSIENSTPLFAVFAAGVFLSAAIVFTALWKRSLKKTQSVPKNTQNLYEDLKKLEELKDILISRHMLCSFIRFVIAPRDRSLLDTDRSIGCKHCFDFYCNVIIDYEIRYAKHIPLF